MSKVIISGGGAAGGLDPDELTAVAADVRKGKIAGVSGSDDPVTGTLDIPAANILAGKSIGGVAGTATSDANATAGYIYNGRIAYVNGSKVTGNMTVGSILNFSAAAYSTTQILLQWQNPYAATGKPFSGIHVWYSTSGYPGSNGTWIYSGYGNNTAAGGWSQVVVNMPASGVGYYFSARPYVTCSAGDIWGDTLNAYAATTAHGSLTFTWSQVWTVPAGVRAVDVCCVGGGSGGGGIQRIVSKNSLPAGGAGGYVNNWYGIGVAPGQQINIEVGAGGAGGAPSDSIGISGVSNGKAGGRSAFGSYIAGGANAGATDGRDAPSGGSGAGGSAGTGSQGGNGGSNGGNGGAGAMFSGGAGQGFTTQAFGGTLYAGGGGGGGGFKSATTAGANDLYAGKGGAGGGGKGGYSYRASPGSSSVSVQPESGGHNTGGGGGGGIDFLQNGGSGGSGVVIIRW